MTAHPRALVGLEAISNERLVSLSRDGILRIQNTRTGEIARDYRDHPGIGIALAIAPERDRVVTLGASIMGAMGTSADTSLMVWDAWTRSLVFEREVESTTVDVDITPDGRVVVACDNDGQILVMDGETGETRTTLEQGSALGGIAVSPDGRFAVVSGSRGGDTVLWDIEVETSEVLREGTSIGLQFVAEGEMIVLCTGNRASLWRTADLTRVAVFQGHAGSVTSACLSADGTRLATASNDGTLRIWNAATGDQLLSLTELPDLPSQVEYLPDGDRLAVGFEKGGLHVFTASRSEAAVQAYLEGRRVLGIAHRVLAPLFDELVEPDEVVRRLQANEALDRAVLKAALNVANRIEANSQQLEEESWSVVASPFAVRTKLDEVVWKARLVCTRDPASEMGQRLLGAAYFRLGEYELALRALERSDASRTDSMRRARPDVAAFLAMTNHHLERPAEAAAQLDRLRGLMSIGVMQSNRDSVALMAEAEGLLD